MYAKMMFTDGSEYEAAPVGSATKLGSPLAESAGCGESECRAQLLLLARRQTGAIPEEVLVQHVLSITPLAEGADWPVRQAALEALLRRYSSAHKDALRQDSRPKRPFLGVHPTRRSGRAGGPRPYVTVLQSVDPPAGSCDCADFLKNSLGLCKHLLILLETVYARPERLRAARREQAQRAAQPGEWLQFHPIRPLSGPGDWLLQVRWHLGAPRETRPASRRSALYLRLRGCFAETPSNGESFLTLHETFGDKPQQRLTLVEDLATLLKQLGARKEAADPALGILLAMERERLQRQLDGEGVASGLTRCLNKLKQPLYPYQLEGVRRFLLCGGRLLLGDDMGLGKTAQAIAACHALWHSGKVTKGLVTVPASLKTQWLREWQSFSAAPIAVVEGSPAERAALYKQTNSGFLIVNYEQVLRDLQLIQAFAPQLVVLDEAQRIKNWATKTASYIKTLEVPYRLVLTGTPMENRLTELASLLDWVDRLAIEPKWRLGPWHSQQTSDGVSGARNLHTLRQRLSSCMLRRVRKDVLRQLPARTDTSVPVELTPQQRDEHDALNQPIAGLIAILRRRPLSPAQHLRLMSLLTTQRIISNGLAQLRFAEVWPVVRALPQADQTVLDGLFSPKLSALRELITQLVVEQGRKVVVFSQWRRMLRLAEWAVRDILAPLGARSVFFTGGQSGSVRTQAMVEFHDHKDVRVMFLTDAGGVGLNLQRAASACINLELPWNPAMLEQRISRIYRIGQKLPINVYNLVATEGIEARITELVGNKKALFSGLFDGTTDEICFERSGSLLSRIEQLVGPGAAEAGSVLGASEEAEGDEDTTAGQQLEALLAAADESADEQAELVTGSPGAQPAEPSAGPTLPTVAELTTEPAVAPIGLPPPALPKASAEVEDQAPWSGEALRSLLAEVKIRPSAGGGLTIEATPTAAVSLAALLSSMASMLTAACSKEAESPG